MDVKEGFYLAQAISSKTTRSGLQAARIIEVDERGKPVADPIIVHCMFNPYEYTISQSNTFKEQDIANTTNTPKAELSKIGAQTLKLNLLFDAFEELEAISRQDVVRETKKLWKFMSAKPEAQSGDRNDKRYTPLVAFHWGTFYFVACITNMSQKYTLFTQNGTPVRAQVDITFIQYADIDDYPKQNPTSGEGPVNRLHQVVAGDRLDLIANHVYHDPSKWRLIAAYNNLLHPNDIRPGQLLTIPFA